ncbi:CoA transferase [Streptomyces sp. NPDC001380]|uniref:CoA transferase n=1 Tax=Streptomyces sp. NPDC001380 TaxID=3364566 RepID=UPI0036A8BE70
MLGEAWTLLGGDPAAPHRVRWTGPEGLLPARLPLAALAGAAVGAAALAAAELAALRTGAAAVTPAVTVDAAAVATAFAGERHLRRDGEPWRAWAPLSRFWPAADGWVRTHANYPHHRERLLAALGVPGSAADPAAAVAAAVAGRPAEETARLVTDAGGLAVAVRTPQEWAAHPQGAAAAALPLLTLERTGAAPAARPGPPAAADGPLPSGGGPLLPAAGLRVLDLTRVIAGPVGTRTLGLLGADVLRIDSPRLPEIPEQHLETGFGKRSALLDLDRRADRDRFEELLGGADAVVIGYRPGALDRHGLSPEALLERRPGLTVATVDAWGPVGPWAGRRGFDSLVQAASGIAHLHAAADGTPGALPVQGLDHATGYLLAAAVLRARADAAADGGGRVVRLSLARTAAWLLRQPRPEPSSGPAPAASAADAAEAAAAPYLAEADTPMGRVRHALPPVHLDGGPRDWRRPVGPWGADPAAWA